MFSNQSAELSLNAPCRSVSAVTADSVESRFLVGTCALESDDSQNHIHVVRYHSDVNDVGVDASLVHPSGPIERLCASPHDKTLVLTLAQQQQNATANKHQAILYKLPAAVMEMSNDLQPLVDDTTNTATDFNSPYGNYGGSNDHHHHMMHHDSYNDSARLSEGSAQSLQSSGHNSGAVSSAGAALEPKASLDSSGSRIVDMVWRNHSSDQQDETTQSMTTTTTTPGDVLTLEENGTVTQWDVSLGMAESVKTLNNQQHQDEPLPVLCTPRVVWDPHHGHAMAVAWGRSLRFLDSRTSAMESQIKHAHRYGIADVDYNPNKPFTVATSGLDGLVHFWDIRSTHRPCLTARGGHSHYVSALRYNPCHDQLVLSTGTDARVNLWRVSSISSAPLLALDDDNDDNSQSSESNAPNARVAMQDAGEAVYGAAWSAADAWLYLTVAYDGKVALHHVPSKEKYKILL